VFKAAKSNPVFYKEESKKKLREDKYNKTKLLRSEYL
jgi:hypothetical protein